MCCCWFDARWGYGEGLVRDSGRLRSPGPGWSFPRHRMQFNPWCPLPGSGGPASFEVINLVFGGQ
jgi:hypothetical protein